MKIHVKFGLTLCLLTVALTQSIIWLHFHNQRATLQELTEQSQMYEEDDIVGPLDGEDALRVVWRRSLALAALSLIIAVLGSLWIATIITRPMAARLMELEAQNEGTSAVIHDLRGPLSVITMAADVLLADEDAMSDRQRQRIGIIRSSVNTLIVAVSNILDAAKITARKIEYAMTPISPKNLLFPIAELITPSCRIRGIVFELVCPFDLPDFVIDLMRIEQVINNLIWNSMKFTSRGGRITLSAEETRDGIEICVADTGIGISREDIPKLFRKFEQVNLSQQRELKAVGTGLGLFICKTIVEGHGGRIRVESVEGIGSSFRFVLPLGDPRRDLAAAESPNVPPSNVSL